MIIPTNQIIVNKPKLIALSTPKIYQNFNPQSAKSLPSLSLYQNMTPIIQRTRPIINTPVFTTQPIRQNITLLNNNSLPRLNLNKASFHAYPLNSNIEPAEKINILEYKILNEIGEGVFGKIYRVIWSLNNKMYALKQETLDNMQDLVKRENYVQILRNFLRTTNCQGVVCIYGNYYVQKGNQILYYELMELCERDFEKEIKERSRFLRYYSEMELISIFSQLVSTLAALQRNNITHRDIKPQNILVANGRYKLCDFGEVRIMEKAEGITVQRVRGSELYMSPILFNGYRQGINQVRHNTYRSDVFSLGMCFLFAATLSFNGLVEIREVIDSNRKLAILNKHLGGRYSPRIINIINFMLQTDEQNRPDFLSLEMFINKK
jgi:serine/threonine protein kinase